MIWVWYVAIPLAVIGTPFAIAALTQLDSGFGFAAGFAVVIATAVFLVMGVVISIGRHYDRQSCHRFEQTTQRPTRFVIYTTFAWDCLTPSGNGKWIPTTNLRQFSTP